MPFNCSPNITPVFYCASIIAVLLLSALPVQATPLLGNSYDGILYDVDIQTGLATDPRDTGVNGLAEIAFAPDGTLYGLITVHSLGSDNSLIIIAPATGTPTHVGTVGSPIFEGGLNFDPISGMLFAVQAHGAAIFTLDTATCEGTKIGSILLL